MHYYLSFYFVIVQIKPLLPQKMIFMEHGLLTFQLMVYIKCDYTISDSTIKIEIITKTYNNELFSREDNIEIFGWKKSVNKDKEKNIDFPNGFILRTKSDNGIKILQKIYIFNDKNHFYFPAINDSLEQTVIFQRQ